MPGDKLRFRFAKTGTLRLLSHHDLMRCLERMLRRAALPFKSTAGFHPTPRVVFALSLPLGVEGLDEVVEIEFTGPLNESETLATLRAQAPAGLDFKSVSVVPMNATALPRRMTYRLPLPEDRVGQAAERAAGLMRAEKLWVNRLKPSPKQLNIRPYLRGVCVEPFSRDAERSASDERTPLRVAANHLVLDLWVTQTGTARADELLKLLGVADLLDAGAVVARATVELRDETPETDPADVPPDGPAETLPLEPAALAALSRGEQEQAAAARAVSPAGLVVE
jgi:radical SAM-linked protein